jgi:hypothetical protein
MKEEKISHETFEKTCNQYSLFESEMANKNFNGGGLRRNTRGN